MFKGNGQFLQDSEDPKFLDREACETLMLGLCISHLDNANAILYELPDVITNKLQWVQSMCAKLALKKRKYSSMAEALLELLWLPE